MSNTDSNQRSSALVQRTSTQAALQRRDELEREPTLSLDRMQSSDNRNEASIVRASNGPPTVQGSVRARHSNLQRQQTEKKAEDTYYVDNDYYSLNPWYERQPPKPLFGLGRPFPRTVRPGMLWGRKRAEEQQEKQDQEQSGQSQRKHFNRAPFKSYEFLMPNQNARKDRQGAPTLQIPPRIDENGEPQAPPDRFEAELDGYKYIVTRVKEGEPGSSNQERGVGREDLYDQHQSRAEAHQGLQSPTLMPDSMGDNFHGDHPPLEDSQSVATAETQAEKQEIRHREEEAMEDYYNTYRNPLARFRARYPEALAEFLAVRSAAYHHPV